MSESSGAEPQAISGRTLERALRLPGSDEEIRAEARRLGAGRLPGRGR